MPTEFLVLTIIASIIGVFVLLYFAYLTIIYVIVSKKINIRYNNNPLLKFFTSDDFPGLHAEPIRFNTKNGHQIVGNIYTNADVKDFSRVIIFFHGIGAGHLAYTKEINRLVTDNHLAVISYDNHGTGKSEGKNIIDLSWALVDADYCLRHLAGDDRFKHSQLILVGHSWGGYVAGNLIHINHDPRIVKAVVLNGLPSIVDVSTRYTKGKVLAKAYFGLISRIKMGRYANQSLLETLKRHRLPTLVAHGAYDPLVPLAFVEPIFDYAKTVNFIRPLIYPEHYHFVYLSKTAELKLMDMQQTLSKLKGSQHEAERLAYAKTIDYDAIGQHHEQLFNTIKQFIIRG